MVCCVTRAEGLAAAEDGRALCVDSADCAGESSRRFRWFNPFNMLASSEIPVPGTGRWARSVESVWQGLKLVDGKTEFAMFDSVPRKRPSDEDRRRDPHYDYSASTFLFGTDVVDLVTARYLIYIPTYLYLLEHIVPDELVETIAACMTEGRTVLFFDWDSNFDIEDASSSFSHSALLAAWFGGTWERDVMSRATRYLAPLQFLSPAVIAAGSPERYARFQDRRAPWHHNSREG